ncbi:MAG: FecR domain-containing protein [Prolixibacteraceae bacterium]
MQPASEHNSVEFIHNPDFVEWVLRPSQESDQYWKSYLEENPGRAKEISRARFIIQSLVSDPKKLPESEVAILWNKIQQTKNSGRRKVILLKRWSVAAGILILIGFSSLFIIKNTDSKVQKIDYASIAVIKPSGNEVKLILSNRTEKTFTSEKVELKYSKEGKLETKEGKQIQAEVLSNNFEIEEMNQLVVPRGKRSSVELADGSKLWLNSGSRAIYPVVFNKKNREIFLEGEGYLEVAHDPSRPFYVVTDLVKVKVLGTKFNISAYKDDNQVSVVLVEGSVQASAGAQKVELKPDQIMNYTINTLELSVEQANVLEYISWKDGWMLCNKEPIESITTKISRYYDVKISHDDARLSSMTLTGKLDLKSNCEEVLKVICATAPIQYEIIDNTVHLRIKE